MSKTILLVEDSADDAEMIRLALKKADVSNPVFLVENGSQAIAYLAGDGVYANRALFPFPCILLLDLNLPGLDGFDVLKWVKEQPGLPELLLVVLSGHHGVREINHAYALGADSFLFKPCHPADIRNLVKAFPEHWMPPPLPPSLGMGLWTI